MNSEMNVQALVDLLQLFESAGIEVWLDGGWAVDALLGAQTRPHKDVDIILRVADIPTLREILTRRGFQIQNGGTESNFVLADRFGLEVDVHAIVFDRDGNGVYRMQNGSDWIFPGGGILRVGRRRRLECPLPFTRSPSALPRSRLCANRKGLARYGTARSSVRR